MVFTPQIQMFDCLEMKEAIKSDMTAYTKLQGIWRNDVTVTIDTSCFWCLFLRRYKWNSVVELLMNMISFATLMYAGLNTREE